MLFAPSPNAGSVLPDPSASLNLKPDVYPVTPLSLRPHVRGKFLFVGHSKLYVRGVTYGPFRPAPNGNEYGDRKMVARDFAQMVSSGFNAVRTYTAPPRWFFDLASQYGLRVMVGLAWEQHITFLDDREKLNALLKRVRAQVRDCGKHPAILCYTIGNEIPATIVRWYGAHRIERFLQRLYKEVKAEDPDGLFTYVNYPSTEYLRLPFVDFVCFNVYLEKRERLNAYLARLQNLAGEKPLLLAEIGLDSRRNGEEKQAESLAWQIRTTFENGCAGAFAFAWTDEWHRGGFDIDDWDFGLVSRERVPKPALRAARDAFAAAPIADTFKWPRISVVVCSYNGARTIRDTLEALCKLDYPDYEVIVVNDGSQDHTAAIAGKYGFHLISTENRGLSNARNTGAEAATGEIVAYIDDDAYPDPHWLTYLASTFMTTEFAAVGGPNIAPPGDGSIAECVAHSPGGPVHVLIDDRVAEHIPGCNMAFRRSALLEIGGFDPRFRTAGDDVDVCWRIQEKGWQIGFNPAAMVWHHRRNSLRAYWRQQKGYGKAEALLEAKWPGKYNSAGHLTWQGRLYGNGLTKTLGFTRGRIYQGSWGAAPFQSIYEPATNGLSSLPLMPEWYLLILGLGSLAALGFSWRPLAWALPLLALAVAAILVQAIRSARHASFVKHARRPVHNVVALALIAFLHLVQPLARLIGRIKSGLTVWRRRGRASVVWPWPRKSAVWSDNWHSSDEWLSAVEDDLSRDGAVVRRGGDFDRWDFEVRGGLFGCARVLMGIEDHGGGKQLVRFQSWPRFSPLPIVVVFTFAALAIGATVNYAWVAAGGLFLIAGMLGFRLLQEGAVAQGAVLCTLQEKVKKRVPGLRALQPSDAMES